MSSTISTINTYIYNQVTPGQGSYGANLTITGTGGITVTGTTALEVGPSITGVTIHNAGYIQSTGNVYSAVFDSKTTFFNTGSILHRGVYDEAGGSITNSGVIKSKGLSTGMDGIVLQNGNLTNSGQISSSYGTGVLAKTSANIFDASLGIISGGSIGVELQQGGILTDLFQISGGTYGAVFDNGGSFASDNFISGGKDAILVKSGAFSMSLYPLGTSFKGAVIDEANTGVINLKAPYVGGLTLDSSIASFSGFSTINFTSGSTWTLEGNISELASGEKITGFSVTGDTLQLDGFSAMNDTYVSGVGLELSNGATTKTIDLTGSLVSQNFIVNYSSNATSIAFVSADVLPPGGGSLGSGQTLNTPYIGIGTSETAGTGSTLIDPVIAGGTLEIAAGVTINGPIEFSGNSGVLIIDTSLGLGTTIEGFEPGDKIIFKSSTFGTGDFVSVVAPGVVDVDANGTNYYLSLEGTHVGEENLTLVSDPNYVTLIEEVTCFAAGTQILTARGEIPVEHLRIGDLVKTLHAGLQPIKWIGERSYNAPFANHPKVLPITIRAGALAAGTPARDLTVSPGHAICIDDALIHASRLVNGVSITQAKSIDSITYFHIELENHEVIFAESCPVETFLGEYFRRQFQNWTDFEATYPGHVAPETPCLPLLSEGFALAAIQRRIAARARIAEPEYLGPLLGHADEISPARCIGWARNQAAPELPVYLDIFDNGRRIARTVANLFRADVREAGYGSGHHGFEIALPPGLSGPIAVRRAADGALLTAAFLGTQARAA